MYKIFNNSLLQVVPSVLWCCWLGGRKGIRPVNKLSGEVLAWLYVRSKVDFIRPSWCHCHSLSLASVKSRLVLPFWYRPTWVVPEKGPLNVCVLLQVLLKYLYVILHLIYTSMPISRTHTRNSVRAGAFKHQIIGRVKQQLNVHNSHIAEYQC